jgi:threonine/homoserine/homoserine lactone efflux protein
LIVAIGPIVARMPNFGLALRIASGLYLLHVAWKLWGHTEEMLLHKGGVSLRQVFVTTLLNPKALIFAFAIIPFGSTGDIWRSAPWLGTLSLHAIVVTLVYFCFVHDPRLRRASQNQIALTWIMAFAPG